MKKMKKKGWFSLIYLLAISAGFYWVSPAPAMERVLTPSGSYLNIDPAELAAMLEKKDFLFANVHIPYEGEIAETDTHIPFNKIEENLEKFPQEKGERIVLYCRSGPMSAAASRTLVRLGYTNILNLAGGMRAWEKAGYHLVEGPKRE